MNLRLYILVFLFILLMTGCADSVPRIKVPDMIIVVCLDAFRYDHLTPEITPNLIALKNESTFFSNCHAAGSWTKPSIASIFTGKWAHSAGAIGRDDQMPIDQTTLAEVFRSAGWDTVGISGNVVVQNANNFSQGFETFIGNFNADADVMVDLALEEIAKRPDRNFLLYLHMMETHMPLNPPATYRTQWEQGQGRYRYNFGDIGPIIFEGMEITEGELLQVQGLYNAEAAFADAEIGRLIDTLKEQDLWDNTAFVFFSDHGEELGDRGDWTHGHCLYELITHVPLIYIFPDTEPSEITGLTNLSIIGRSILDLAAIEGPGDFRDDYPCFSEGVKRNGEQKCIVRSDGMKLIWRMYDDSLELYDIFNDPDELTNLFDEKTNIAAELLLEIETILEESPEIETETREPSEAELEQLRALGYVQ